MFGILLVKDQLFLKRHRPLSWTACKAANRRIDAQPHRLALLRFQSELLTILCMFLFNILYPWTRIRLGRVRVSGRCAGGEGHKYLGDLWARRSRDRSALFNFVFEARVTMSFYCAARAQIASNPSRRTNFCYLLFKPHCNPEISLC